MAIVLKIIKCLLLLAIQVLAPLISACAGKKYELLMHVLANAHKGHFDYFVLFEDSIYYTSTV